MSKYTTELRYICEVNAGLKESAGFSQIDNVISKSWNKIFTTTAPLFDESYRQVLFSKILKHYYTQEIAYETVGLWLYHMNTKMEEILPYYNKIYKAVQADYDILTDTDYTDQGGSQGSRNETVNNTGNKDATRTDNLQTKREDNLTDSTTNDLEQVQENDLEISDNGSSSNTQQNNFQATPQGSLTMVSDMNYLTDARRITDDGTNSNTQTNTGTVTTNNTGTQEVEHTGSQTTNYTGTQIQNDTYSDNKTGDYTNTENYVHTITGKRGNMTYAAMVDDYISRLKNVDMLIIKEFEKEFMQLW